MFLHGQPLSDSLLDLGRALAAWILGDLALDPFQCECDVLSARERGEDFFHVTLRTLTGKIVCDPRAQLVVLIKQSGTCFLSGVSVRAGALKASLSWTIQPDLRYRVTWKPFLAGSFEISVEVYGQLLPFYPITVEVTSASLAASVILPGLPVSLQGLPIEDVAQPTVAVGESLTSKSTTAAAQSHALTKPAFPPFTWPQAASIASLNIALPRRGLKLTFSPSSTSALFGANLGNSHSATSNVEGGGLFGGGALFGNAAAPASLAAQPPVLQLASSEDKRPVGWFPNIAGAEIPSGGLAAKKPDSLFGINRAPEFTFSPQRQGASLSNGSQTVAGESSGKLFGSLSSSFPLTPPFPLPFFGSAAASRSQSDSESGLSNIFGVGTAQACGNFALGPKKPEEVFAPTNSAALPEAETPPIFLLAANERSFICRLFLSNVWHCGLLPEAVMFGTLMQQNGLLAQLQTAVVDVGDISGEPESKLAELKQGLSRLKELFDFVFNGIPQKVGGLQKLTGIIIFLLTLFRVPLSARPPIDRFIMTR